MALPVDDDTLVLAMSREIAQKADRMDIAFAPLTVMQLTALIQLACRHPGITRELRATADRFLAGVRAYFADCPAVLDVVRRGDDPREDMRP